MVPQRVCIQTLSAVLHKTRNEIHGAQELRTKHIAVKPTHSLVRMNICVDSPCNRITSLNHYSGCCESFVVEESVRGQEVSAERLARRFISSVKCTTLQIQGKDYATSTVGQKLLLRGDHISTCEPGVAPKVQAKHLRYIIIGINCVGNSRD
jgi:hypothetical protein